MAGAFFTDPSTVNNDPTHYDPTCTNPSPWQEPNGQHRFQLRDCSVMSVMGPTGPASSDPLVGASVTCIEPFGAARLVDLDVYQQGVPTIFGMNVQITLPDGTFVKGAMDAATLNGLWFNAVLPTRDWGGDYGMDSYGGDMNACGYFVTVIRVKPADWTNTSSPMLQQLKSSTITDANGNYMISFKFVTDAYENVPQNAKYRLGRIIGAFGPLKVNEPLYNAGKRWMQPRPFADTDPWFYPSFNPCIYTVDTTRNKLVIDLSNSICRQSAGGPPVDLGTLNAVVTYNGTETQIGTVDYSDFCYNNNAHIAEIDISPAIISLIQQGGVSLVTSRNDIGNQSVLFEQNTSVPVEYAVEVRPVRMPGAPGTTATTKVYVSKGGVPVVGKQMSLAIESVHGNTPGATVAPTNPGNTNDNALTAAISTTDANGYATITLTIANDPGQRTPWLDGQLYFVIVYDPNHPDPYWLKNAPIQEHLVSVITFSDYPVNKTPQWQEIQNMMMPYVKLYPSMKAQIDLTDLHTFTIFSMNPPWDRVYGPTTPPGPLGITAGAIPYYMSRDFNDPRFMPISRDLSPNKILTLMYYVQYLQQNPPPAGTTTMPSKPNNIKS
jgi:hypothetical protein